MGYIGYFKTYLILKSTQFRPRKVMSLGYNILKNQNHALICCETALIKNSKDFTIHRYILFKKYILSNTGGKKIDFLLID